MRMIARRERPFASVVSALWLGAAALGLSLSFSGSLALAQAPERIRLPEAPTLSPDGATLVFSWGGDLWSVPTEGGAARRLTVHNGQDTNPVISPDGETIAFTSDRGEGRQVHVMPLEGGTPEQLTYHTEGYSIEDWYPDGRSLLVRGNRDHFWRHAGRFLTISGEERSAERPLFDADGENGSLSPEGDRLLFTREGVAWWRKGYRGSQASQVWMYDLKEKTFEKLLDPETGARSPIWRPDGEGFYYLGVRNGAFNLIDRDLDSGEERVLTRFDDDSVVLPTLSRDGKTLVFRHLFDLYRIDPTGENPNPERIAIRHDTDSKLTPSVRESLNRASEVAFTEDGLEIAFIAGGDLWVMDTELREPVRITDTPEEESSPVFSPDGDAILFISDAEGQSDIWKATRRDEEQLWWLNTEFDLKQLTRDAEVESNLSWSPEGSLVAFVKGLGELWVMEPDGSNARRILEGWNSPDFVWAPDGRWIAYARSDNNFNSDIWILSVEGGREPFNVSKHPDVDRDPAWSPDGKVLAFTGRRYGDEVDVFFVYLEKEEDEKDRRDRKLEEAIEKIRKARKQKAKANGPQPSKPDAGSREDTDTDTDDEDDDDEQEEAEDEDEEDDEDDVPEIEIDFERLHERIRRVSIPSSRESGLFWSHDSKKLAFVASVNGQRGTYTIEPPDDLSPKRLTSTRLSNPRWIQRGNQIVGLSGGRPTSVSASGSATNYNFQARQEVDLHAKHRAAFELCWRLMRDRWYDENLNNRNWDAIRRKYVDVAGEAVDPTMLRSVVNLMLGELNGSHLGFYAGSGSDDPHDWPVRTAHLGLRFDPEHTGPGLKVRDVIPEGPTDQTRSKVEPGELVIAIDGQTVDPDLDLTQVLNGPLDRDLELTVRNEDDEDRTVTIRPITYGQARSNLYDAWVRSNRENVEEASEGRFGYLHIAAMSQGSFYTFEEELYSVAAGKDGLIIDVRENGGGSTADRLLTSLTQPVHAITVPRGGGPGYPQDRKVYASWPKPIVVLCNQNSFSNAEIFSHAIKTLERGPLVGVTTAGGVISTGGTSVMDVGFLRLPFRGWFVISTGEDMELKGAEPDVIIWPEPGDWPRGIDTQLDKAIELLDEEVTAWKERPQPELRKASERQ